MSATDPWWALLLPVVFGAPWIVAIVWLWSKRPRDGARTAVAGGDGAQAPVDELSALERGNEASRRQPVGHSWHGDGP